MTGLIQDCIYSPRDAEKHLNSHCYLTYLFFFSPIWAFVKEINLAREKKKNVSTVYLISFVGKFAIISFMVISITKDSRSTKDKFVPGSVSWYSSKRSFTEL